MRSLPTPSQCLALLKQEGCSEEVIAHCIEVRNTAVPIAKQAGADVALVESGSLLHDIGRATTHGIRHGIEGGRIAKRLGLPAALIRIIERHVGTGISKEKAVQFGLPRKDYIPQTLEEKIISHADNSLSGSNRESIETAIEKMRKKNLDDVADQMLQMHEELSRICGQNIDTIPSDKSRKDI